jgi:hypothetical protein
MVFDKDQKGYEPDSDISGFKKNKVHDITAPEGAFEKR